MKTYVDIQYGTTEARETLLKYLPQFIEVERHNDMISVLYPTVKAAIAGIQNISLSFLFGKIRKEDCPVLYSNKECVCSTRPFGACYVERLFVDSCNIVLTVRRMQKQ